MPTYYAEVSIAVGTTDILANKDYKTSNRPRIITEIGFIAATLAQVDKIAVKVGDKVVAQIDRPDAIVVDWSKLHEVVISVPANAIISAEYTVDTATTVCGLALNVVEL